MRAFCINLDRRPDRWIEFQWQGVPTTFQVERFPAVDGWWPPSDWKGETAAHWNCLQSHVNALSQALAIGLDEVAVFEDDCVFAEGFEEKLAAFLPALPDYWDAVMLGGRHRVPPKLQRVRWTDATHAYWVRGRSCIRALRDLWASARVDVDVAWRPWQEMFQVFAPQPFLCGQAAGTSDVNPERDRTSIWWGG